MQAGSGFDPFADIGAFLQQPITADELQKAVSDQGYTLQLPDGRAVNIRLVYEGAEKAEVDQIFQRLTAAGSGAATNETEINQIRQEFYEALKERLIVLSFPPQPPAPAAATPGASAAPPSTVAYTTRGVEVAKAQQIIRAAGITDPVRVQRVEYVQNAAERIHALATHVLGTSSALPTWAPRGPVLQPYQRRASLVGEEHSARETEDDEEGEGRLEGEGPSVGGDEAHPRSEQSAPFLAGGTSGYAPPTLRGNFDDDDSLLCERPSDASRDPQAPPDVAPPGGEASSAPTLGPESPSGSP